MDKKEFKSFVSKTLDELWLYAEIHANKKISGEIEFKWQRKDCKKVIGKSLAIDEIVRLVYVGENLIYPCCDLIVMDLSKKDNLIIEAWIANYEPRPFQKGWSGRPGPFIYCVNQEFIHPNLNTQAEDFKLKLDKLLNK